MNVAEWRLPVVAKIEGAALLIVANGRDVEGELPFFLGVGDVQIPATRELFDVVRIGDELVFQISLAANKSD